MLVTKQLQVPIDFNSMKKKKNNYIYIYQTLMGTAIICLIEFFKVSYYMFNRRQKLIQVWNNLRPSKWQNIFGGELSL